MLSSSSLFSPEPSTSGPENNAHKISSGPKIINVINMCREWYSMFQTQVCRVWGGFQYRSICTPQRELPSDGRRLRDQLSGVFHFVNIRFEKGRVMGYSIS